MTRSITSSLKCRLGIFFCLILVFAHVFGTPAAAADRPLAEDSPSQGVSSDMSGRAKQSRIGYVEVVVVNPGNLRIKAKIDTGARSSSIDTINIVPFMKDGKRWVRFTVRADDDRRRQFEMPVRRIVRVKRASAPVYRRYVVEMGICLAGVYKKSDVNLTRRDGMNYRMLIGRLFTAGDFVVDPNAVFLSRPTCQVQ